MTNVWRWLERNSAQIQGLAAVATILAALAAVPFLLSRWVQPELTIKVTADSPTIPLALEEWIDQATLMLRTLPAPPQDDPDPFGSLRELQGTGPLEPIRRENSWRLSKPGRLRVDVVNQVDHVIPGVRLRLERAYPSWGVTLAATFLTAEEVATWQKAVPSEKLGPAIVLPELPPLPPQSAITIVAYGDVADAKVSVTVPDASFKFIPTVRVEDKGVIALILRPYWLPFVLGLVSIAILGGLAVFENLVWRRARRHVAYDLACKEAKAGRNDGALALLQEAVEAGYSDLQHMQRDPDLERLRESDAFKKLVGS